MQRVLFGVVAVLGLGSLVLVTAAFALPTDETAEPNLNERFVLEHEAAYDSFVPVHYPDLGVFVMREISWTFSVYLERDPTSGCELRWVPALEAYQTIGDIDLVTEAPRGVFYDEALGTIYGVDGEVLDGPGARPLSEVAYTKPHNWVQLVRRDILAAEPGVLPHRVCTD